MEFTENTRPEAEAEAKRIKQEYGIDDSGGENLLASFAAAYSLELNCQEQIDAEGLTIMDRFEQPKPHPLLASLRDARAQKLAALKAMNLDIEPLKAGPGRPPGPPGRY